MTSRDASLANPGVSECRAFRGLRYARADRFASAELTPFDGTMVEGDRGPLPPQNPSRFDAILGPPAPLEQREDCQVLSIFTPATTGQRPVMIWFHGGAFITGGGELPWYDGTALAVEQDVVVVSVTARLGALGYLFPDGLESAIRPSPAMTDQLAAVEWVHRYIEQFGGDPENITLFGQSAGGFSIEVMLRWGIGPEVRGAIVQSGFIKQPSLTHERDTVTTQAMEFRALLNQDPRSATVAELLAAQAEYARQVGTVEVWGPVRPSAEKPVSLPLLAGWTKDDTLPYVLMENDVVAPDASHFALYGEEVRQRNAKEIARGTFDTLDDALAHGQRGWAYEFELHVPTSGWGAPHCMDLPFLLGDHDSWRAAPIVRGADWSLLAQQGSYVREIWASFARDQDPGHGWIAYHPTSKPLNRLRCSPQAAAGSREG